MSGGMISGLHDRVGQDLSGIKITLETLSIRSLRQR